MFPLRLAVPAFTWKAPLKSLAPAAVRPPPERITAPATLFEPFKVTPALLVSDAKVLPVTVKVVPDKAVTAPSELPVPKSRVPALRSMAPSNVAAPATARMPAPDLTRPNEEAPSVSEPSVKVPAETVAVRDCPREATPEPKFSEWVPVKVNEPPRVSGLSVVRVRAEPEELLNVVSAPTVNRPVPRAEGEARLRVPAASVMPPAPELAPESVNAPAPVLRTKASKVTSPETASEEVPVPSTDQVWEATIVFAATRGAEIVTAPALAPTTMPPEVLAGAMVRVPEDPWEIRNEAVAGVVALVNWTPSTVKSPSSVEIRAPPVRLLALNTTVSAGPGVCR